MLQITGPNYTTPLPPPDLPPTLFSSAPTNRVIIAKEKIGQEHT